MGNGDSTWPIFLFSNFVDVKEVREEILNLVDCTYVLSLQTNLGDVGSFS